MSAASSSPSTSPSTSSTGTAQPPLSRTDRAFLDLAFEFKEQLPTRPILSGFRVLAIFTYTTETHTKTPTDIKNTSEEDEDEHVDVTAHDAHRGGMLDGIPYIVGTNCEISAMGQSICAERSALAKLRLIPFTSIGDIYLVSDASFELAPGLLCREFLSQWLAPQRRIILASADIGVRSGYSYTVTSLARLYPHPPLYRHHAYHADVIEYAQEIADKAQQVKTKFSNKPEWETLYQQVVDKTSSDRKDVLYPIRLAAGIRFSNGDVQLAAQTKLAEFGHTMDPLTKLLIYIENYREKDITPEVYMMSDQFGVLHPPSATARAHLFEGNHPGTLLYHDSDGTLHSSDITTLVPEMPNVIESSFDQAKETLKQRKATQLRVQQQQQQQQQHKHSATCHH